MFPQKIGVCANPALQMTLTVSTGTSVRAACKTACKIAKRLKIKVIFMFNGERMVAWPDSKWKAMVKSYAACTDPNIPANALELTQCSMDDEPS